MHGAVRRVGTEVHEERFFAVFHLGDEALGIIKKDISAKALRRHGFAVVKIGTIKVGVIPEIRRLAHAAATVSKHLLKAAILRAIRIVVAQVPFTEHTGMITAIAKNFADGHLIMAQHGTTHDRMPYAGAISPAAGDQCRPRRRTGRSHVVIREPHTVRMQLIQMRRLQDRVAMTRQIAIALVIGNHQHHVRPFGCLGSDHGKHESTEEEQFFHKSQFKLFSIYFFLFGFFRSGRRGAPSR